MKDIGSVFIRIIDDKDNKVEDGIDEHVEISLGLFFAEDDEILDEIFEKLLCEKFFFKEGVFN